MPRTLDSLSQTLIFLTAKSAPANTRLMDLLADHLTRARASGGVFARTVAAAPWGLRLPGSMQLALHAVGPYVKSTIAAARRASVIRGYSSRAM